MALATYSFLPWLRRGIANRLQTPASTGASRAQLTISMAAASEAGRSDVPPVTVKMIGPGDITGFKSNQVIRTEPRAGVTNFEANYLAAIDFYDEDFPWRYSPMLPDAATHRLTPWLTLVALKEGEFTRSVAPDRPLTSVVLTSAARRNDLFPVAGQEWAWAHVHLNENLGGTPAAPDLGQLNATLAANPDLGYARLICSRKLDPNTSYTMIVTPTFEVGRKAGLGETVADDEDGSVRAWAGPANEFPIYYEWTFRTGVEGDFESLVRALVPRDMDPRVGIRDMDIAHPGFGADSVSNPPDNLVRLEGALLAPTTVRRGLAATSDFVPKVEPILNAPAEARQADETDPLVAPPIYGCWPAQVERVSSAPADAGWVNSLNLDPRYRGAAGLGARVIRKNQEKYMRSAWAQIGDVLAVNQKIRRAQLAIKAAFSAYTKSTLSLAPERALALASPILAKVIGAPKTLRALVKSSRLPAAGISAALRKQLRPRGQLAKRILTADTRMTAVSKVVAGLNAGTHTAAPARLPVGGATVDAQNIKLSPYRPRPVVTGPLHPHPIEPTPIHPTPPLHPLHLPPIFHPPVISIPILEKTAARPNFRLIDTAIEATLPGTMAPPRKPPTVPGDNPAAADLRSALLEFNDALGIQIAPTPAKPALDLASVQQKAVAALEPHAAFAQRFAGQWKIGGVDALTYANSRYTFGRPGYGVVREIMNYPDIKDAMYQPLDDISTEYFVPNLKLIPNNTISLMQTNQPFIESYLVGLNHEFARELLWREYPTDQQGSYFRQFWDVSNYIDCDYRSPKDLAEFLKDIPALHTWTRPSALGSHNHRDAQGDQSQVVLVLRGDLLKRYPNTFIYAQRATWGTGTRANRLVMSDETGEVFATNPKDPRLRFPLYQAKVDPDITFIGFDLTFDEVRGDPRLDETAEAKALVGDDTGWFFVLQEAIGEPRFGMDVNAPTEPSPMRWDNLSWANLDLSGGQSIDVAKAFVSTPTGSDNGVSWGANAADQAFILYQEPVMVGVHGRNMLKNLKPVT
ncbi:MAG TPA: hypothetical protein VFT72_00185 [Opitutaceae bacterium]|nr:hypothetical protein [Opitutaceae bacterium]